MTELTKEQVKYKAEAEALAEHLADFLLEHTERSDVCLGAMAIVISRIIRGKATDSDHAQRLLDAVIYAATTAIWPGDN